MKILITGATGFLGKHIFEYLNMEKVRITAFKGDLRYQSSFSNEYYDYIIHSAALVDKKYWDDKQLFSVNVGGTRNIINYYNNTKVIFISSTDITAKPTSPYSQSKMDAEEIIIENKNNLITRFPCIFGPGDRHNKLIPLLFNKYLNNGDCQLHNNDVNNYVFVTDAAKFIFDNIKNSGLVVMDGISVTNYELNGMIKSICNINGNHNLSNKHIDFYENLTKCKVYYKK